MVIKNIKVFFIISTIGIIVTGIYIGKKIFFGKNNIIYIDYTLNYEEINSYIGNNIYYPKKNPEGILLDNKYLELLFENPELKALYEEKVKEDRDNIATKRRFCFYSFFKKNGKKNRRKRFNISWFL